MNAVSKPFNPAVDSLIRDTITRPESPKVVRERKSRDFDPATLRSASPRNARKPLSEKSNSLTRLVYDLNNQCWTIKYAVEDEDFAKGAYGKIMLAKDKATGEKVVIKKIPQTTPARMITNEVKAGKIIGMHPNIAGLLQYNEKTDFHYLVFQHIQGQDLFTYLERLNFAPRTEAEARSTITQILNATLHVHQNNIAHRDIKLENVLIDNHGRVYLIDLGLCAFVEDGKLCRDWCGSDNYLAPEIVRRIPYNGFKADVFSIGVVLFALLFGVFPFENLRVNGVQNLRTLKVRFPSDVKVSASAKDLILKMLEDDPEKRFSISDVLKNEWINIDNEFLSKKASTEAIPNA
jgi:serine/threonine protein kinase